MILPYCTSNSLRERKEPTATFSFMNGDTGRVSHFSHVITENWLFFAHWPFLCPFLNPQYRDKISRLFCFGHTVVIKGFWNRNKFICNLKFRASLSLPNDWRDKIKEKTTLKPGRVREKVIARWDSKHKVYRRKGETVEDLIRKWLWNQRAGRLDWAS